MANNNHMRSEILILFRFFAISCLHRRLKPNRPRLLQKKTITTKKNDKHFLF